MIESRDKPRDHPDIFCMAAGSGDQPRDCATLADFLLESVLAARDQLTPCSASSDQAGERISVRVDESTQGGTCYIVNPWDGFSFFTLNNVARPYGRMHVQTVVLAATGADLNAASSRHSLLWLDNCHDVLREGHPATS